MKADEDKPIVEFESWNQFAEFSQFVKRKARHILDEKNKCFLQAVLNASTTRKMVIQKGVTLWRAQRDNSWRLEREFDADGHELGSFEVEAPLPPERMTPPTDSAYEGRVNVKGIPCLYLSTDMKTAMTETRPWIGSYVSVAQFVVLKNVSLVDCSADSARVKLIITESGLKEPDRKEWTDLVWGDINRAFSEPVTRADNTADYAPTQFLAEAFRSAGYDGVVYGSKLGVGRNVALFDLNAAELVSCSLYRVEGVDLKYSFAANPYVLDKGSNTTTATHSTGPNGADVPEVRRQ